MRPNEEDLMLGATYKFDVVVDNEGRKFAGKLMLSPIECTLRVSGETSDGREISFGWGDLESVTCRAFRLNFVLFNLKIKHAFNGTLERHPIHIGMFEFNYEIEYVISSRLPISQNFTFAGLELNSSLLNLWVGETTIQHKIISKFHKGTLFDDEEIPNEFEMHIDGIGTATFGYETSMHFSVQEYSSGLRFPPRLGLFFDEEFNASKTVDIFNELRDFISVVIGQKICFERIRFFSSQSLGFDHPTLYFSELIEQYKEGDGVLFPFGGNRVRNDFGLPEFPIETINTYFNLPKVVRTYFKKYVKYRELENPEERFLGYFRLLEKLTFKKESFVDDLKLEALLRRADSFIIRYFGEKAPVKALLRQITRVNQTKLNTASCICRFMDNIPSDVTNEWVFKKSDIAAICKLRNDLTHANEMEPDDSNIEIRAKFIEIVLLFSLFQAVEIQPEIFAAIMPRMRGYGWIKMRSEPKIIKMPAAGSDGKI